MGSKQNLLTLLPSTNNMGSLWLLAKDSSAALSPLTSVPPLPSSSCAMPLGPQFTFGPSVQLQWQSRTVMFHKAHWEYLCGEVGSHNLETAGLPRHPQIKIICKQRPKLCLPHWWWSRSHSTGLLWIYKAVNYFTGGSLNLVCQKFKIIFLILFKFCGLKGRVPMAKQT